jgi:hypothetical protein
MGQLTQQRNTRSTAARNFLFEAAVAAKAHHSGRSIKAILDARSDTGINVTGKKIWVECKRVTTVDKIESNARKASIQLETILAAQVGSGHRRIVVLDVSKILNRGEAIYQGNLAGLCGVAKIKGCVTSVSKKNRARMRHLS